MACGRDQPRLDPDVPHRCRSRALPARHDHQRDGVGRSRDRARGGGRRRHHRRREHRAPAAPESRRGTPAIRCFGRARSIARSAKRDRLRDADHHRGDDADLLPRRAHGSVLQATRRNLRPGGRRLPHRRADNDARAVLAAATEGLAEPWSGATRPLGAGRLRADARADRAAADNCAYAAVALTALAGIGVVPITRARVAPELQGARLPHALADVSRHVGYGGDEGLGSCLPGAPHDPGRSQLRLAHRAGVPLGRAVRDLLRRELDQCRSRSRLRPHARERAGGGQRLPRHPTRCPDLSEGTDPRGVDRIE